MIGGQQLPFTLREAGESFQASSDASHDQHVMELALATMKNASIHGLDVMNPSPMPSDLLVLVIKMNWR